MALQRMLQEQQLKAQQLLLQQQLLSAAGANNAKSQKEQRAARRVYVGNLVPQMVSQKGTVGWEECQTALYTEHGEVQCLIPLAALSPPPPSSLLPLPLLTPPYPLMRAIIE